MLTSWIVDSQCCNYDLKLKNVYFIVYFRNIGILTTMGWIVYGDGGEEGFMVPG